MVLRDSEYKGSSSLNDVYDRLNSINDYLKEDANKIEFKGLVEVAMAKMETVE